MGGTAAAKAYARAMEQDWTRIGAELDEQGWALLPGLLDSAACTATAELYDRDDLFRSRVVMARHGFGRGEYRYFAYPLPKLIADLRTAIYPYLVPTGNRWNESMGIEVRYPEKHGDFIE